jgi:hypothetical protein
LKGEDTMKKFASMIFVLLLIMAVVTLVSGSVENVKARWENFVMPILNNLDNKRFVEVHKEIKEKPKAIVYKGSEHTYEDGILLQLKNAEFRSSTELNGLKEKAQGIDPKTLKDRKNLSDKELAAVMIVLNFDLMMLEPLSNEKVIQVQEAVESEMLDYSYDGHVERNYYEDVFKNISKIQELEIINLIKDIKKNRNFDVYSGG